jgi:hypothetical protein
MSACVLAAGFRSWGCCDEYLLMVVHVCGSWCIGRWLVSVCFVDSNFIVSFNVYADTAFILRLGVHASHYLWLVYVSGGPHCHLVGGCKQLCAWRRQLQASTPATVMEPAPAGRVES